MPSTEQSADNHPEYNASSARTARSSLSSSWLHSTAAVMAGVFTVVFLSLATDQVLHVLEVYPPWGQPMRAASLNLLALSYRTAYNVAGGYVTARLAPRHAERHANVLGIVGTVMGLAGAIATIPMNLGPAWYPIALVITALPGCWLGGVAYARHARAGN